MLNVPEVLKDRKGADLIVRTSYGAVHQGKLLNTYDDRITLEGKLKDGPRVVIHIALDCILEVMDLGMINVLSMTPEFSNRPPVGMA